jgi:flagellar hook assembly protein FlgD
MNGEQEAGYHTIEWNSTNSNGQAVASGMYFIRMASDDFNAVRKVLLMK